MQVSLAGAGYIVVVHALAAQAAGMQVRAVASRGGTSARHLAGAARLLAMKGRYPAAELTELPAWLRVEAVEQLVVPGLQEERHLVIMSVNP